MIQCWGDNIVIHTAHISILQLGIVCKAKGIPEPEEIVRQAVSTSVGIGLFSGFGIHRELPLHDTQFDQILQVDTGFGSVLDQRFCADVIELCIIQRNCLDNGVVNWCFPKLLVQQKIHFAVQHTALGQNIPLDVLRNGYLRIELPQIMGDSAENGVGQYFILVRVVGKKLDGIVKSHRGHFVNTGGSAVQWIFFGKQFFFDKAHGAAAQNDHHILILEFCIPQILQDRRNALIPPAHIGKLVNDEHLLPVAVRQIQHRTQRIFPIRKLRNVSLCGNILLEYPPGEFGKLHLIGALGTGVKHMRLVLAEFPQGFCLTNSPPAI